MQRSAPGHLTWLAIARLGLIQAMLGAVVVLTTSTLNRVMVVELALPALVPGLLVALHHALQMTRPRMGFGADQGGRSSPWILGGMAVLALGGLLGAVATAWMSSQQAAGLALAVLAFALVGIGVSACGTSLLVLLAKRVDAPRRAAAASTVWVMMIIGFAVTAGVAGRFLDPYSPTRLVMVSGVVSLLAVFITALSLWRLEDGARTEAASEDTTERPRDWKTFRAVLAETWQDADARRFTIFVFVSMVAYSTQDLILEPFAGAMFGLTPGQTTQLSGVQHGGALAGMLLAALAGRRIGGAALGSLKAWTVGGCLASALALLGLVAAAFMAPHWPVQANVFLLGITNGAFAIAAIGSMMHLAGAGSQRHREGTRMGLWGAAQAVGFAIGGLFGAVAADLARWWVVDIGPAYGSVFFVEAMMFVAAAVIAARVRQPAPAPRPVDRMALERADETVLHAAPTGGAR